MKGKKWVSRILAVICAIAVGASSMELPIAASTGNANGTSQQTTVLGIDDFIGGAEQKNYPVGSTDVLTAGAGNLDGVVVDGLYNIARYGQVQIGTASGNSGYRLQIRAMNNATDLRIAFFDKNGQDYGLADIPYTEIGYSLGSDIPIRVAFTYGNRNDTTGLADVAIKVNIGDLIERDITVPQIPMDQLTKSIYVHATDGAVTLKVRPEETTTVLGIDDFIDGAEQKNYPVGSTDVLTAGTGNLDRVVIDGLYNIARYGQVQIGTANGNSGYRLQIRAMNNATDLRIVFHDKNGQAYGLEDIPYTDIGYSLGSDIPIRVEFTYENRNYITGLADLAIKVNIGDLIERDITVPQIPMDQLTKSIYVHATDGAVTLKVRPEETTTVLGIDDFIDGAEQKNYPVGSTDVLTAGAGNLDRVVIDGLYNIARYGQVQIGTASGNSGYRLQIRAMNNATDLRIAFFDKNGQDYGLSDIPYTDIGYSLGSDIPIRVEFTYGNRNYITGMADLAIKVNIGDLIERDITVPQIPMDQLTRSIYVHATDGAVTLKVRPGAQEPDDPQEPQPPVVPDYNYTMVGMETLIGGAEATYTAEAKPGNNNTMNGYMLEGLYNLTKDACVYIGTAGWYGLRVQLSNGNLKYWIAPNGSSYDKTITPTQADMSVDSFEGVDVPIKVGMHVMATNPDGTVELVYHINIGEYSDAFILSNVSGSQFSIGQRVHVLPGTGTVILKAMPGAVPEVPDGFAPTYDKVMKFTDFGITEDTTVAGSELKPNGGDKLSLDKIMVEGTFSFSGLQSAAYIGSRGWGGLRFGGSRDGFTYQFMDNGGQGALHVTTVTSEDTGCDLFDADVRIKGGFTILSEDEAAGTVDAIIEVQIGDTYQDVFAVQGVKKANLIRGMHLYAAEGSSVTLKVDQDDLEYIDESDNKKLTYDEEMTFYDFAITKDYVVENKQTRVRIANETLDGVSIEGTYFMTGNVILGFGGDWKGLQLQRTKTGMLYQYLDVDGKGTIYSKSITEEDTGCALYDKDVDIKVGFNFSNENKTAGTADVTIEVNIGPTYRDVFTVQGVKTANLQKWMLLYAADANSGLTGSKLILRKPYMEPFDFREFGFTTNWKEELKLNRK